MIQSFKILVFLDDNFNLTFTDYNQFKQTQLIGLLNGNNAFQNFTSITFTIDVTLQNQQTETQILKVCLQQEAVEKMMVSSGNSKKEFIEIPVSFATDRNDTKDSDLNERFGGKRSELQYGRIVVSIPYTHTLGEIERPSYWRLEFSEDPSKHMMMQSLKKQSKEDFFKQMKERIAKNGKSTFLFVHGYNVSFADAAFRTAQITFDLRFPGEAVFYSWPSQASTTSYTVDEANIEWSTYNMKNFLKDYLTKTEAKSIYLVAHSMGNRGLTKALIELMNEQPELKNKITEIILAAPDIDADVFKRDIGPKMISKIGKPITLYVSSDDLALLASKKVHGSYRAGEAGAQIVVLKGIETIDASGQDSSFLSHSYFATTSNLIKDI
ncbi:MAG: alpha/beta hydrolase, partial [Polaribacter sp.]|nr:alpha/beta hydrolase [Polaribacter sp.]